MDILIKKTCMGWISTTGQKLWKRETFWPFWGLLWVYWDEKATLDVENLEVWVLEDKIEIKSYPSVWKTYPLVWKIDPLVWKFMRKSDPVSRHMTVPNIGEYPPSGFVSFYPDFWSFYSVFVAGCWWFFLPIARTTTSVYVNVTIAL